MNFIDEICSVLEKITDAPKLFIRGCAYFLVSMAQGVKVDPVYFDFRPNIWILFSSPPALTRRSTLISRYTVPVFKKAYSLYLVEKYGIKEQEARKIANSVFLEYGTVEGLVDAISDALEKYKVDRFAFTSAEFGGCILAAQRKDYLSGFFQLLSKLFDGEDYSESLSKRGKKKSRYLPPGLFVCSLVGMQRPQLYLSREQFEQGLMRRYVFIYQGAQDKSRWVSLFNMSRVIYKEKLFDEDMGIVAKLKRRIKNFTEVDKVIVEYKGDDLQKIQNDYDKLERVAENRLAEDEENLLEHFRYTCVIQIPRLMILEALGRYDSPKYKGNQAVIELTYDDFKRAVSFIQQVFNASRVAITLIDSHLPKKIEPLPTTGKIDQTLEIIELAGEEGISDSDLLKSTGILKAQLREILTTLAEREDIIITKLDSKDGVEYRFYHSKFKDKAIGMKLKPALFYNSW